MAGSLVRKLVLEGTATILQFALFMTVMQVTLVEWLGLISVSKFTYGSEVDIVITWILFAWLLARYLVQRREDKIAEC